MHLYSPRMVAYYNLKKNRTKPNLDNKTSYTDRRMSVIAYCDTHNATFVSLDINLTVRDGIIYIFNFSLFTKHNGSTQTQNQKKT